MKRPRQTGAMLAGLAGAALLPRLALTRAPPVAAGVPAADPSLSEIGGDFLLTGTGNLPVASTSWRGRFGLLYFGYTHCPDECPTTLSNIAAMLDQLPAAARAKIVPVFVTIDPERDSAKIASDYAHAFGADFIGLSGSLADITTTANSFKVYFGKRPLKGGDYAMDHSSILYLIGPDGKLAGLLPADLPPKEFITRLHALGF